MISLLFARSRHHFVLVRVYEQQKCIIVHSRLVLFPFHYHQFASFAGSVLTLSLLFLNCNFKIIHSTFSFFFSFVLQIKHFTDRFVGSWIFKFVYIWTVLIAQISSISYSRFISHLNLRLTMNNFKLHYSDCFRTFIFAKKSGLKLAKSYVEYLCEKINKYLFTINCLNCLAEFNWETIRLHFNWARSSLFRVDCANLWCNNFLIHLMGRN